MEGDALGGCTKEGGPRMGEATSFDERSFFRSELHMLCGRDEMYR